MSASLIAKSTRAMDEVRVMDALTQRAAVTPRDEPSGLTIPEIVALLRGAAPTMNPPRVRCALTALERRRLVNRYSIEGQRRNRWCASNVAMQTRPTPNAHERSNHDGANKEV